MIYHIISMKAWTEARQQGVYEPPSLHTDKFIHCSTEDQVSGVANTLYKGAADLLVLGIQEDDVDAEMVYEDLYDLHQLFPHIYGRLNLNAVHKIYRFEPDANGVFAFRASADLEYQG